MTPAIFAAMVTRKELTDKYQDSRFGMIVATIINLFRGKEGKPVGALQVMGYDEEEGGGTPATVEQTPAEMALRFRLLQAGMVRANGGGKKKGK